MVSGWLWGAHRHCLLFLRSLYLLRTTAGKQSGHYSITRMLEYGDSEEEIDCPLAGVSSRDNPSLLLRMYVSFRGHTTVGESWTWRARAARSPETVVFSLEPGRASQPHLMLIFLKHCCGHEDKSAMKNKQSPWAQGAPRFPSVTK